MRLDYISDIAGLGALNFGLFAPIITILAVIGAINAFNMVDGIYGLLAIITFTGMAVILKITWHLFVWWSSPHCSLCNPPISSSKNN